MCAINLLNHIVKADTGVKNNNTERIIVIPDELVSF